MHFSLPILGSLFALASARCGTVPHPRVPAMHAAYQAHEATLPPSRRRTRRQDGDGDGDDDTYTVKVFVHVITSNNTLEGGNIPQETIDKQIEVLNGAYASAGFTFVAENATYTEKEEWRRVPAAGDKAHEMMSTLRQGKYRDLNIYLTTIAVTPEGEALAYA
ncbi:hypothetical protein PWT90_08269 [Aphanocladium album]|nr:hypothetical protein PWT90_08269 [Aphanocladium album]